jgi:hypothetical protein
MTRSPRIVLTLGTLAASLIAVAVGHANVRRQTDELGTNANSAAWTVAAPSAAHYRLGALRFDGELYPEAQSLDTAIRAFGRPSSCVEHGPPDTIATWKALGLRGEFTTLGGIPHNGKPQSGCVQPDYVRPDHYDLYGRRWHTDLGVGHGSSVTHLKMLYPAATRYGSDYWLSTRPAPWYGPHARTGLLIAHTHNGRVTGLELSLQAEGE